MSKTVTMTMLISVGSAAVLFAAAGCGSMKTADDFVSAYCECVRKAPDAPGRQRCEMDMVMSMAEQMSNVRSDESKRGQMQSIINDATEKMLLAKKECGDTTRNAKPPRSE